MKKFCLKVLIEINGRFVLAGQISGTSSRDAVFSYADSFLSVPNARAISLSFPLSQKEFDSESTKIFFDGLLPEGFTRQCVANNIHSDSDDYISILRELGSECLGAIQIVDEENPLETGGYNEVSLDEIKALAKEGAGKSAEIVIKSHLSLTGASGKVGLYYDEKNKKWFKPQGLSPSTHIIKQSHIRYKNIVLNEQLCLLAAQKLGIEVPESFIIQAQKEKTDDENVLFATSRFDRVFDSDSKIISGFRLPYRLHQEDFAQALGIKSERKYEKDGEEYLQKMFGLIRKFCSNPIEDSLRLWRRAVFNYLIGNTDNHIKNASLLYSKDLASVRLAPCYDVICTRLYEGCTDDMSLSINGKLNINQISRSDFEAEAKNCGLGSKIAMKIYDELEGRFEKALKDSATELTEQGFSDAKNMAEQIINWRKR